MLTNDDSISFNCGRYGKETLEITPAHIREHEVEGLKIKILFRLKKKGMIKSFRKYSEIFLIPKNVASLYALIDNLYESEIMTNATLQIDDNNMIELSKSTIQERTSKGDIITTEGIQMIIKRINTDGYYFTAITTLNNATTELLLNYLDDFVERAFQEPEELTEEQQEIADQEFVNA